ncbi:glycosyltransferase family A protein [Catenovulum sp. SX2]|uniref:glycosyltransferase family A protein n=1 Tax=Catenovulum sp. SX2 TaxID=3398614 RepID=UPI003F8624A1
MDKITYSIVMFAYNEEKNIEKSLKSVFDNVDENLQQLTVIANGCTDNTVSVLQQLKQSLNLTKLRIIELTLGDKCNAWNQYVHQLHDDSLVHFFVDADVEFTQGAFAKMAPKLVNDPDAAAIAGLPFSGRNIQTYRDMVIKHKCLFGNCYALKLSFLHLAQQKSFYLPIGLGWIDSAITKVVKRDIEDRDEPMQQRVIFDADCGYKFTSLSVFNLSDIKLYFSRIARYQTGKLQEQYLEKLSFVEWPRNLAEINQKILQRIEQKEIKLKFYLKNKVIKRLQKQL